MKYAIYLLLVWAALKFLTYVFFAAVMSLKFARDAGRLPRQSMPLNYCVLWFGYALDVIFNVLASIEFFELPKEWLFTDRVKRHIKADGWRAALAKWYCATWLTPIDPGHCK